MSETEISTNRQTDKNYKNFTKKQTDRKRGKKANKNNKNSLMQEEDI